MSLIAKDNLLTPAHGAWAREWTMQGAKLNKVEHVFEWDWARWASPALPHIEWMCLNRSRQWSYGGYKASSPMYVLLKTHLCCFFFLQYLIVLTQQWASNTTATSWTTPWSQSKSLWQTRTTGTQPRSSVQEPTSASRHPTAGSPSPFSVSWDCLSSIRMQRQSTQMIVTGVLSWSKWVIPSTSCGQCTELFIRRRQGYVQRLASALRAQRKRITSTSTSTVTVQTTAISKRIQIPPYKDYYENNWKLTTLNLLTLVPF